MRKLHRYTDKLPFHLSHIFQLILEHIMYLRRTTEDDCSKFLSVVLELSAPRYQTSI